MSEILRDKDKFTLLLLSRPLVYFLQDNSSGLLGEPAPSERRVSFSLEEYMEEWENQYNPESRRASEITDSRRASEFSDDSLGISGK